MKKISKSKQELARIISENGGWFDGAEWASQDKIGVEAVADEIAFYEEKPSYQSGSDMWNANQPLCTVMHSFPSGGLLKNWHQTILSRDEYFHLYPAPGADGWIEWSGGACPVDDGVSVEVKRERFIEVVDNPEEINWVHYGTIGDIIAYRLHKPEQVKPEPAQVEEAKPTIEQLASDYRNRKDYADRKQQEADDAKADADEALRKLELAGEEIGIIVTPITAKQESELVITDWRDLRVGDVIRCLGDWQDEETHGMIFSVDKIESPEYQYELAIRVVLEDGSGAWGKDFEFIHRP